MYASFYTDRLVLVSQQLCRCSHKCLYKMSGHTFICTLFKCLYRVFGALGLTAVMHMSVCTCLYARNLRKNFIHIHMSIPVSILMSQRSMHVPQHTSLNTPVTCLYTWLHTCSVEGNAYVLSHVRKHVYIYAYIHRGVCLDKWRWPCLQI